MLTDEHNEDECATCGKDLTMESRFFMCDELLASFCEECWPKVQCEEKHGEGCETVVWT